MNITPRYELTKRQPLKEGSYDKYRMHPPRPFSHLTPDHSTHKWFGVLFCQQEDAGKVMQEIIKLCGRLSSANLDDVKVKLSATHTNFITTLILGAHRRSLRKRREAALTWLQR
jgi:hypothetical protein